MSASEHWGWAGSVEAFLAVPRERWRRALELHYERLLGVSAGRSQIQAWDDEHAVLASSLRAVVAARPAVREWRLVFEYELPLEGGRRPDVAILAGPVVAVLEFKSGAFETRPHLEQVASYAADLADFHAGTHGRALYPMLVASLATRALEREAGGHRVVVTGPGDLAHYLDDLAARADERVARGEAPIDPDAWLAADYAPIPMLVTAARRYFAETPLPHVKHALAERLEETVQYLHEVGARARQTRGRVLAFVTGVPGAGKTLVGIRLVYEQRDTSSPAVFLSGNGPLVKVLRDALGGKQARVFVRDLHEVVRRIAKGKRPPSEVLVFDEAQRAWDRERMAAMEKDPIDASEPDVLVSGAERLAWSVLVGLVGEGQEIHVGEESGMRPWADAIDAPNAASAWTVHCAPKLQDVFARHTVVASEHLDLDASIRTKRAGDLHRWVADLLAGRIELAARRATRIHDAGYPLWVTRDLDEARAYAKARYPEDDRDARYGLLCSSSARFDPKYALVNKWWRLAKEVDIAAWFNAAREDPRSCCALTQPITQFECQGLELSTAIVCWGDDYRWAGEGWAIAPRKKKVEPRDPQQLALNAYRVVLTRGRDGLVVWVPPSAEFDETARTLLAAGMRFVPEPMNLGAAAS